MAAAWATIAGCVRMIGQVTAVHSRSPLVAPAMQAATIAVYRQAIANMFGAGAVIVLVGLVALIFIPATVPTEPPARQ